MTFPNLKVKFRAFIPKISALFTFEFFDEN